MCKNENPKNDWTPEPFPEPRTIPENWNASALSEGKNTREDDDPDSEWEPDPFPEPRMFLWRSRD